jgi:hypothetical protein
MLMAISLTALFAGLAGAATGWWLSHRVAWCPTCGNALTCSSCGCRPGVFAWTAPGRVCAGPHPPRSTPTEPSTPEEGRDRGIGVGG